MLLRWPNNRDRERGAGHSLDSSQRLSKCIQLKEEVKPKMLQSVVMWFGKQSQHRKHSKKNLNRKRDLNPTSATCHEPTREPTRLCALFRKVQILQQCSSATAPKTKGAKTNGSTATLLTVVRVRVQLKLSRVRAIIW